jgi:hypothetical protein
VLRDDPVGASPLDATIAVGASFTAALGRSGSIAPNAAFPQIRETPSARQEADALGVPKKAR